MNKQWGLILILTNVLWLTGTTLTAGQTEAGLTLLEAPSARPAALAEAFSAIQKDISGLSYNPASISDLSKNQVVFLYQKGVSDDSFGQISFGHPIRLGGLGVLAGYYDGGQLTTFDGTSTREISAQKDLIINVGVSRLWGPVSWGVSGKYLSSTLAEVQSASTLAGDFGLTFPILGSVHFGAALQNVGRGLRFEEVEDKLPRVLRAGLTVSLSPFNKPSILFLDSSYFLVQKDWRPAVGLETMFGPLALRMGLRENLNQTEITMGGGFALGETRLDYAVGFMNKTRSKHRMSVSFHFGSALALPQPPQKEIREEKFINFDDTPTIQFPLQEEK